MGHVKTRDGNIYYETAGEGPPLLLIMGLGGSSVDWTPEFILGLAAEFKCIVYDQRGCGQSDPPAGPVTIPGMARDAASVLDHLRIARADIVGLSLGGMVAQRLALDHADRVRRLVLVSTCCGGSKGVRASEEDQKRIFFSAPGAEGVRNSVERMCAPGLEERRPGVIDSFVDRKMERPGRYRVMQAQLEAGKTDERFDLLPKIAAPTLIISGDSDPLLPLVNIEMLHGQIPNSRVEIIPDCGHLPMLEYPERLRASIGEFLCAPQPA